MNTKTISGISLAALFAVSMISTGAYAAVADMLDIKEASSDGETHSMQVAERLQHINSKEAPDLVTFWAWVIETPEDAPEGTALAVDAITIHHRINDQAAFDAVACPDDKSPQCQAIRSSPVQGFHPHRAFFDENFCVIGLESPKADFRVFKDTLHLEASDLAGAAATGTIGDMGLDEDEEPICPIANLGITELVDGPVGLPFVEGP
ncbi:MAG: hypothetical protein OEL77_03500 [Nitrosopumilus sp.]|nr:hypothetical protein [Nitrosopumilus sp.]MDH3385062.1 hypothetical protein [Nitrosopumilus sp.]